jgi:hypothetical protein
MLSALAAGLCEDDGEPQGTDAQGLAFCLRLFQSEVPGSMISRCCFWARVGSEAESQNQVGSEAGSRERDKNELQVTIWCRLRFCGCT